MVEFFFSPGPVPLVILSSAWAGSCLSVCLPVYLSVCLSLSACLPVCERHYEHALLRPVVAYTYCLVQMYWCTGKLSCVHLYCRNWHQPSLNRGLEIKLSFCLILPKGQTLRYKEAVHWPKIPAYEHISLWNIVLCYLILGWKLKALSWFKLMAEGQ